MKQVTLSLYFAVCVVAALIAISLYTDYYPFLNDFWGNYYLSLTLSIDDIGTLYNAFFPIGYIATLRILDTGGNPAINAMFFNIFLIFILYIALSQFSQSLQLKNQTFLIALALVTLFPPMFSYLVTVGADIGAVTFFSLGVVISVHALKNDRSCIWKFILCGVFLGLAGLWRYHAFVGGLLLLISYFLLFKSRWKMLFIALATLIAIYLPQVIIYVLGGASSQNNMLAAFIYKAMYGINWHRITEIDAPESVLELIESNPVVFVKRYIKYSLLLLIPLSVPPLACLAYATGFNRRISLTWLLFTALYCCTVSLGASERAILLPLPISLIFASYALTLIAGHFEKYKVVKVSLGLTIAGTLMYSAYADLRQMSYQHERSTRHAELEGLVAANNITNSFAVYSTGRDVYFRNIKPHRPAYSGGWIRVGGTFIAEWLFKEPSLESLDKFIADCKVNGFRLVYLIEGSEKAAPFLEDIRVGTIENQHLKLIKKYKDASLFAVR